MARLGEFSVACGLWPMVLMSFFGIWAEPAQRAQPICRPHRAPGDQSRHRLGCRRAHSVEVGKEFDAAQQPSDTPLTLHCFSFEGSNKCALYRSVSLLLVEV
jgi:hypothetical protein